MVATLSGGSKMSSKPTQQRSDLYSRTSDAIKFRAAWLSLSGVIWCSFGSASRIQSITNSVRSMRPTSLKAVASSFCLG